MPIIKKWLSDFVLSPFISACDFLNIDFLSMKTHTGSDIQNPVAGRLKYSMKSTYLPEIRYTCLDWLERLRQSQMT